MLILKKDNLVISRKFELNIIKKNSMHTVQNILQTVSSDKTGLTFNINGQKSIVLSRLIIYSFFF